MKDFKIIELMELFDEGEVTTADQIDRPQKALDREMFQDASKRFSKADGGMLVQPSADGSRPGYATSSVKTEKFKYPVSNQFGTFYSDKKPEVSKKIIVQDEKTKFINKLVSEANAGDKHVSIGEIGEKVKKKFKLKNAKSINVTSFPNLKLLESRADKIDKVLRDMLISDKPLNGFWHNVISERTGIPINKPGNLRILNQSPTYNSIKDQGLDLLKVNYSRKSFNYLHNFSLSDQLTKALEIAKGNPTYIGLGGEKLRTALPSNKIMEFALRSWNTNKGSKDGPIQFFDKNGKRIIWKKGIKLPYKNVSFSFNGKMHKKSNFNTDYMKKFFPEVYNNQIAINNLSVTKVDNPFKPGSKITVKDLIKKIQVDNYGWSPRFPTLEILHGQKGVAAEPFSNLTYATRDINQLENSIKASLKAGNIKPAEANKLIKTVRSTISGKTGDDLKQSIVSRQIDLAKQKDLTFPRIKEMGIDEFKKSLAAFSANPKCRVTFGKKDGGRINYATGPASLSECAKSGRNRLEKVIKTGVKLGPQEGALATQILRAGRSLGSAFTLSGLFGPAAIAFTGLAEAGIVGYDMLTTGKTFKEAIGDSLFNYALGEKTKIDPQEELFKRFSGLGFNDEQINKFANVLKQTNTLNTILKQDLKVGNLKDQVKAFRDQPKDQFVGFDDEMLQTDTAIRAEQALKDEQKILDNLFTNYRKEPNIGTTDFQGTPFSLPSVEETILGDMASGKFQETQQDLKAANIFADLEKEKTAQDNFLKFFRGARSERARADRIAGLEQDYLNLLRERGPELTPFAGGGIAKLAGIDEGPQTESLNPDSQGLSGLLKRAKKA